MSSLFPSSLIIVPSENDSFFEDFFPCRRRWGWKCGLCNRHYPNKNTLQSTDKSLSIFRPGSLRVAGWNGRRVSGGGGWELGGNHVVFSFFLLSSSSSSSSFLFQTRGESNHFDWELTQEWPWPPVGTCELLFEWLLTLLLPAPPPPPPPPPLLLTLTLGTCELALASAATAAAAAAIGLWAEDGDTLEGLDDAWSGGGASLRGGIRSLMASNPLASSNDVILWVGENPCKAARQQQQQKDQSKSYTALSSCDWVDYRSLASLCLRRGRRAVGSRWGSGPWVGAHSRSLPCIRCIKAMKGRKGGQWNRGTIETGTIAVQRVDSLPQDGEDTGHFADGSNLVSDNLFADGSCFPLPENVISLCVNGTRHDRMHSKKQE